MVALFQQTLGYDSCVWQAVHALVYPGNGVPLVVHEVPEPRGGAGIGLGARALRGARRARAVFDEA